MTHSEFSCTPDDGGNPTNWKGPNWAAEVAASQLGWTHEAIRQFCQRFGAGNCWTGSVGKACTIIHQLLEEVAAARREAEEARNAARRLTWVDTGMVDE